MTDRFWSKVRKEICWIWTASKDRDGYGYFQVNGKACKAHRVSYAFSHGEIPHGMLVCHRCDNPSCVNPDHLFLGTSRDNMQDKVTKGRMVGNWGAGENVPTSKLTEAQVIAIREDTRSRPEIAKEYGVSRPLISLIQRRKIWKCIP